MSERFREVRGIHELLAFTVGRTVAAAHLPDDFPRYLLGGNVYGVTFTDGSALAVTHEEGFHGTEVTPAEPPTVRWFIAEKP